MRKRSPKHRGNFLHAVNCDIVWVLSGDVMQAQNKVEPEDEDAGSRKKAMDANVYVLQAGVCVYNFV